MLDRKLDNVEDNSREHSAMAAKLILLIITYMCSSFWYGFAISFEPTRKSVLDIMRSCSISIHSIDGSRFVLWKHEHEHVACACKNIIHEGTG